MVVAPLKAPLAPPVPPPEPPPQASAPVDTWTVYSPMEDGNYGRIRKLPEGKSRLVCEFDRPWGHLLVADSDSCILGMNERGDVRWSVASQPEERLHTICQFGESILVLSNKRLVSIDPDSGRVKGSIEWKWECSRHLEADHEGRPLFVEATRVSRLSDELKVEWSAQGGQFIGHLELLPEGRFMVVEHQYPNIVSILNADGTWDRPWASHMDYQTMERAPDGSFWMIQDTPGRIKSVWRYDPQANSFKKIADAHFHIHALIPQADGSCLGWEDHYDNKPIRWKRYTSDGQAKRIECSDPRPPHKCFNDRFAGAHPPSSARHTYQDSVLNIISVATPEEVARELGLSGPDELKEWQAKRQTLSPTLPFPNASLYLAEVSEQEVTVRRLAGRCKFKAWDRQKVTAVLPLTMRSQPHVLVGTNDGHLVWCNGTRHASSVAWIDETIQHIEHRDGRVIAVGDGGSLAVLESSLRPDPPPMAEPIKNNELNANSEAVEIGGLVVPRKPD